MSKNKKGGGTSSINDWLMKGLTECLQFEPPVEVVKHLMLAETEESLVDYLENLLDMQRPVCKKFVADVVRLRNLPRENPNSSPKLTTTSDSSKSPKDYSQNKPSTGKYGKEHAKVTMSLHEAGQLDRILLPGRKECQCLATKHELVGNCVKCGRIVCQQEGPGPCFFCGNQVGAVASNQTSASLKNVLGGDAKAGDDLEPGLAAALKHRDTLLEYDRCSAQRTKIYDDQSDFFNTGGAWLNEAERKKLIEKQAKIYDERFGARRHRKVALDFAGRQIVDVAPEMTKWEDDENENTNSSKPNPNRPPPGFGSASSTVDSMVNPNNDQSEYPQPKYVVVIAKNSKKKDKKEAVGDSKVVEKEEPVRPSRLQDSEILEMADRGVCLSVQQPYASLIVLGIKQYEGRTWATSHRGRLWIVSSSKPCSQEQISTTEKFYKLLYHGKIE